MPSLTSTRFAAAALALVSGIALGQQATVLSDLDAQTRTVLTKEQLTELLPGAKMRRTTVGGSYQAWTNEPSGSFVISTDNRGLQTNGSSGNNTTARGTWKITDDARYCIAIEWKRNPNEEWCRMVVKSGDSYYVTRSDKAETERVYKLEISK